MNYYKLDDNGNVIPCDSLQEWINWEGNNPDRKIIGRTYINNVLVSTVFLGLNHNWNEGELPIVFETMIFQGKYDGYQDRYSTMKEAMEGHLKAIDMVRSNAPINESGS